MLTRAEDAPAPSSDVAVGPLVEARVDAWWAVAAERGVDLDVAVDDLAVRSEPGRLEQVLDNLLSNALDVAPRGSSVRVLARAVGERVQPRGPRRRARHDPRAAGPGLRPVLAVVEQPAAPQRLRARPPDRAAPGRRRRGDGHPRGRARAAAWPWSSRCPPRAGRRRCGSRPDRSLGGRRVTASDRAPRPGGARSGCGRRGRRACSPSSRSLISSDTHTQTSCRTQWPSQWSCSSTGVASGPSTALRIWARVISVGRAGQDVPAADPPLRADQPRALQRRAGSARGTAGGARCARRSP